MAWLLDKEINRELPEEWGGIVPTEVFIDEAQRIVEEAEEIGILLRIMGGLAVAIHSGEARSFAERLGRTGTGVVRGQEYSDIDYMSYRKQRNRVKDFFDEMGYAKRRATLSSAASERQIFFHPKGWFYVDVFYDDLLVANHPLSFKGRLERDRPTIPVTDILLEKIQMWEAFGIKDLKDCLVLIRAHRLGEEGERDSIDSAFIAKLLARDWGFWYTATNNLKKISRFVYEIDELGEKVEIDPESLGEEDRNDVTKKIEDLLDVIEREPKSFKWKMRSKVGTAKRWYNPVERPETVAGFGVWEAILKKE